MRFTPYLLLAVLALPAWASAPEAEVYLQTRRFIGSQPQRAVADFLRDLRARRPEVSTAAELTVVRTVAFYDTPGSCELRSRGLHLRRHVRDPGEEVLFATPDGLEPRSPLVIVNDLTIEEKVFSATWPSAGDEVRLDVVLWYTEPPIRPLVARVVVAGHGAAEVVATIRELVRWVEPQETPAMEVVYRGFCD